MSHMYTLDIFYSLKIRSMKIHLSDTKVHSPQNSPLFISRIYYKRVEQTLCSKSIHLNLYI